MIIVLLIITLGAVAGIAAGSRTNQLAKVRESKKTTPPPVAAHPTTYFERYMPRRTSGPGEPL